MQNQYFTKKMKFQKGKIFTNAENSKIKNVENIAGN